MSFGGIQSVDLYIVKLDPIKYEQQLIYYCILLQWEIQETASRHCLI